MEEGMRVAILCIAVALLAGCVQSTDVVTSLVKLPTGEIVSAATDRLGVHERVRASEEATKRQEMALEIEREKTKQARLEKRAAVQITISDKDSLAVWALSKANDNLARSNEILGEAVSLLTGHDKYRYQYLASGAKFPEGAFAEFARTILHGGAEILETPTAGIVAGGWALDKVLNNRPATNQFSGDVHADNSFNASTLHQTGSTGNPSMQPTVVRPEVVHADVVELPSSEGE
jgi:hypothetical protein